MLHSTIAVVATAYCDRGRTATGTYVHQGTVAVDPSIIPLRSNLRLQIPGWVNPVYIITLMREQFARMTYHAEDTGGAIRGNRMDIWMPSCSDALAWGRRTIEVEPTTIAAVTQRRQSLIRYQHPTAVRHVQPHYVRFGLGYTVSFLPTHHAMRHASDNLPYAVLLR